jgi:molybdate transport system substrate-binding protein
MTKTRRAFGRVAGAGFALLCLAAGTPAHAAPTLTVAAAASLKDVLAAVNARFAPARVLLTTGSSGQLENQIRQGAPIDVFISADEANMDRLAAAHLIDARTRRDVAANRLVLIVPAGRSSAIHSFGDLGKAGSGLVALGETHSVPAGIYARQVLEKLGIYACVQKQAVFCKDVRAVRSQVELANVAAGIVYASDAAGDSKVRIVAVAPERDHGPILYPAAALRGSKSGALAHAYIQYLGTRRATALFRRYGFLPVSARSHTPKRVFGHELAHSPRQGTAHHASHQENPLPH